MNQLLRLPLLKYTQTEEKNTYDKEIIIIIIIIIIKTVPSSLPKNKKGLLQISHRNSQGIGAVNCCHKDLHPTGRSYPRFSSFLCK